MPRKMKPRIWERGRKPRDIPCVVIYNTKMRAIGLMLRDMWVAAVGELATRSER